MPYLNALDKFKDSFNNIANEKNDIIASKKPFDDFTLPRKEAAEYTPVNQEEPFGLDDLLGQQDSDSAGDFDFNAFLNNISDEKDPPSIDDIFSQEPAPDTQPIDSFPDMDSLLDGFTGESTQETSVESTADSFPDMDNLLDGFTGESTDDFSGSAFTQSDDPPVENTFDEEIPMDMGGDFDLPDFNIDETSGETPDSSLGFDDVFSEPEIESEQVFDSPDSALDFGGEKQDGTFTSGEDSPEIEAPPKPTRHDDQLAFMENFISDSERVKPSPAETDAAVETDDGYSETGLPDFDIPGLDSFDIPGITDSDSDIDFGTPDDSFEGTSSDSFDGTSIDSFQADDIFSDDNFLTDSFQETDDTSGLEPEPDSPDTADFNDDFSLSGIDDLFDKGKKEPVTKTKTRKQPKADENAVEEILLTEADLEKLRRTLSTYPLNLRIICEELIAEHVLAPHHLSRLIRYLINGASVKETAALAEEILGKSIVIPKSFEKSTGEELEAERASFAYIFIHNFLPVFRLIAVTAALGLSIFYLGYRFFYTPIKAESLYKRGYERIFAGEYQRANALFQEAFLIQRKKNWFYLYAEGFRDERRYMLAEEKYDELLRYYPRDKKGVLDYAHLQTNYLLNYEKANSLLHNELLDYAPNDYEGLLASGDNFFAWADSNPSRYGDKYEDARYAYSRLLEKYGWKGPIVERMMYYFIRTDNLKEVLELKVWFENNRKERLSTPGLSELGGYLLDKQLEEVRGVPDEYLGSIDGVRNLLLQAVREDVNLPEPHYHLARYYHNLNNVYEERLTLENAIRAFDLARSETVRRRLYRVDSHYRYANLLTNNREFFKAEEHLIRSIELYEDFMTRNLITTSPQYGKLFAARGDLEYFVKSGNMQTALNFYHRSERNGWAPPEIQYRMGAAYYQLEDWQNALAYLFRASADLPLNRRMLFALGNTAMKRGDFYTAQGYYNRLLNILESQRTRLPVLLPNDSHEFLEVGERLMMARNNAGVAYEALAEITGSRDYRSRALVLYAESARAWDSITRNPITMTRMRPAEGITAPGVNLGYLNANNALRPDGVYRPEIFIRIDKDVLEPSIWEELIPMGRLGE